MTNHTTRMFKTVIRFEKLWASYMTALETYDAAKVHREEGPPDHCG